MTNSLYIPRKKHLKEKIVVYGGKKKRTTSNLRKKDLILNKDGKVVSKNRFYSPIPVSEMIMRYPRTIPKSMKKDFENLDLDRKVESIKKSRKDKKTHKKLFKVLNDMKEKQSKKYSKLSKHIMKKNEATAATRRKIKRVLRKLK